MNHLMTIAGTQYEIAGDRLRVIQRGDRVLDVRLSPTFDGEVVKIASWERDGRNGLRASLGAFGEAHLAERFERLAFWIETPVRQFEHVTYLSDGALSGRCGARSSRTSTTANGIRASTSESRSRRRTRRAARRTGPRAAA